MKYDPFDYRLCRAEGSGITIYIVEEVEGECREIIVDWDLSDEEEDDLIARFNDGELDFFANDGEWLPEGEAYKGLWDRSFLA